MRNRVEQGKWMLLIILIGWLTCLLCGCKSVEYVPIKEVRNVVLEQNGMFGTNGFRWVDESTKVTIHDSVVVVVNQQGEEVSRKEFHEKETDREYREKYEELLSMYESLRSEKTDTIEVPYPVEKDLSRWEQTCVNYGGEAIVTLVVMIVGLIIYVVRKFFS